MDSVIKYYPVLHSDKDLNYCKNLAYQKDMTYSIPYGQEYYEKYIGYEDSEISININRLRVYITEKYCFGNLIDIGIGSGEFIKKSNLRVYGFDINPVGINWLKSRQLFVNPYMECPDVCGWTFWDVLEHIPDPHALLCKIKPGQYVFVSIPTFQDIMKVKESKHYRPDEHYYYFTVKGFIDYMADCGFVYLEDNDAETEVGRESITTFVFLR